MSNEADSGSRLGTDSEEVSLGSRADVLSVVREMTRQAQRELTIISRHLDPSIFEDEQVYDGIKRISLGGRNSLVRILVLDSGPLIRDGHRLLDLAQRVPSTVKLKLPGLSHKKFNEAWIVVDTYGYVRLRFSDRYEGSASFADRLVCRDLSDRFEEMWEFGREDPNLRRLSL